MRRITAWLLATASVVGLVFAWKTSTEAVAPSANPALGANSTGAGPHASAESTQPTASTTPQATKASSTRSGSAPTQAATKSSDGTYVGTPADTRYGPVTVQVTIAGGTITDVKAIAYPTESGRDQRINSAAIPILNREALSAQSAKISWVSGATYTSQGYATSLQSALDRAGR